jgi:PKD repeat protein
MTSRKPLTRLTIALAAVAATVAAVLVVAGPGYDATRVRMFSGAIWLASVHTGQVTLVDGTTAEVKAKAQVAEPGTPLSVVQHGGTAYALNQRTGLLSRVDTATERVFRPVSVLPASDGLVVKSAPDALHVIDVHSGTVASADLATLARQGEPHRMGEAIRPDGVAVDGRGRVWAIGETGDLVRLAGGERRTSRAAGAKGRLAITEDQPAVVDPERGAVDLFAAESVAVVKSLRADLGTGDTVAVSGSVDRSRVLIANSTRGELVACTFDSGSCSEPVRVSAPGAELGNPVEVDNHAVVPDYSTGQAAVVDLGTTRVVAQRDLFSRPTRFELFTHDGIIFFNDPNGNIAGVLDLAGDVRTTVKYVDGPPEVDAPSTPDPRALPDRAARNGQREEKPEMGIPRKTVQPVRNDPVPQLPASGATISVSPDNRGVVGDEFELTLLLRSPAGEWNTEWLLGDGSKASDKTIRHRWQQPGVFTVKATATFSTGAKVLAETTVTVDPPDTPPHITSLFVQRPKPVIGESVRFSADSTARPDSWAWTIGRPGSAAPEATARTAEFTHTFSTAGTYAVTLTITKGTRTATSTRQFTVFQGAVKAWGRNSNAQATVPLSATSGVVAIEGGNVHSLALKADGSVIAWGSNEFGQTDVPEAASRDVIAIAAGRSHSMALTRDGSVLAWGLNDDRQTFVPPSAQHGVVAIAASGNHSLALKEDGSVIGWGDDSFGQASIPPEAKSGVTAIAAGDAHSLALKSDGSVAFWGEISGGGPRVPPEAMNDVVAIAAGDSHSLAMKADGTIVGWGFSRSEALSIPEEAMSGVIMISTGTHSLALKEDGSVISWGLSRDGVENVPPEYSAGVLAVATGTFFSLVVM